MGKEVRAGDSLRNEAQRSMENIIVHLRYIRKPDASGEGENQVMGYKAHNRVFNDDQERELSKYLIRCADIYFDQSKKEVKKDSKRAYR